MRKVNKMDGRKESEEMEGVGGGGGSRKESAQKPNS
jgi:hypothetical protein